MSAQKLPWANKVAKWFNTANVSLKFKKCASYAILVEHRKVVTSFTK